MEYDCEVNNYAPDVNEHSRAFFLEYRELFLPNVSTTMMVVLGFQFQSLFLNFGIEILIFVGRSSIIFIIII